MSIWLARPDPQEAPAFAALHAACWHEAYQGLMPEHELTQITTESRLPIWQKVLPQHEHIVLGAYDSVSPIGFIMAGQPTAPDFNAADGEIRALYVRQSHWRRGVGRALLAAAAESWRSRGGRSLCLAVLAGNQRARIFYEVMGAKPAGTSGDDILYVFRDLQTLGGA